MGQSLKLLFFLVSLLAVSQCGYYSVSFTCGPCTSVTGCTNNLCFKMSGELSDEVCYGASTCSFSASTSVKIGRCSFSVAGACSSGLCVQSANVDMCLATLGYCLDGTTSTSTCSNSILTMTLTGGSYSTPVSTTVDMSSYMDQCYFSTAIQTWSTCSGDIYGGTCNCCVRTSFSGMTHDMGTCVAESSDLYLVKSSVPASEKFLQVIGLLFIILTVLTL